MSGKNIWEKINKIYVIIGFILVITAVLVAFVPIAPYVWYRINSNATQQDVEKLATSVAENKLQLESGLRTQRRERDIQTVSILPDYDPSLPEGYIIEIPTIGVYSPISTSTDYTEALKHGSWIVSDFGTPDLTELPIIIASHRFGYNSWTVDYRNRISFYNLPNTRAGDLINIYWNQRKYTYEIYGVEDSTYISDYGADLILYTCKYFNSPVRIFRYAKRVRTAS